MIKIRYQVIDIFVEHGTFDISYFKNSLIKIHRANVDFNCTLSLN